MRDYPRRGGDSGEWKVVVLPITHIPPHNVDYAVEIPRATKSRLGLDSERSWIVINEANRFIWPGPDLRPATPGDASNIIYGHVPGDLFRKIRDKWLALSSARRSVVPRTE